MEEKTLRKCPLKGSIFAHFDTYRTFFANVHSSENCVLVSGCFCKGKNLHITDYEK